MEKQINAVQDFHRRIDAGVAHRPCLLCHCEESAREFAIAIRELCEPLRGSLWPDSSSTLTSR